LLAGWLFRFEVRGIHMRLKATVLVVASCLLASVRVAIAAPSTDPCNLPQALQREVVNKYPGARLVTLQDLAQDDKGLFQKDHGNDCPGLVNVDFYGDGKPTFALVLIVNRRGTEGAELVVAHELARKWATVLIDTAESSIPVVWSQGPGEYEDVYGEKKLRATRPVMVLCEYNAWAIVYAWTGSGVDKIWLRD
jgi:hypothetical protein